ncbi:MAG TPA: SDR family oxidoreductase [Acidiferrobacteraceae bacterium]|nr:SDR family oxidoreductase [Acidiferrobacteraceae bacterium]
MGVELFRLDGKVVVVTGGLGQLGVQFVGAIRSAGARVAILDIAVNTDTIKSAYGDDAQASELMFLKCDITSRVSIKNALSEITDTWGTPHGLVNNAALDSPPNASAEENGPFETFPESSWDKVMEVNSKGVFLLCQVIGGAMAKEARGSIINISSIYGVVSPNQALYEYRRNAGEQFFKPVAYSASKSSLLNLTRYLSTYWGRENVRVNTLILGGVFNHQDEEFLEGYQARVPLARMANESEYNGAAIFLLSEASSYMTGADLVLDGGWTAW